MLQPGNTKLGSAIHTFSLPAIKTCPGRTKLCERICYADSGFYCMQNVKDALAGCYRASKRPNFPAVMIEEIAKAQAKIVRIHPSGDFYDAVYVDKWIEIARACRDTVFFAYTRSWRVPEILVALKKLARLKNVRLWWSADSESHETDGRPPKIKRTRVAYVVTADGQPVPEYVNLILRDNPKTLEKYRQGRVVCPAENGMTYTFGKMTCSRCQLCVRDRAMPAKEYTEHALLVVE